jgi:hypothetical protein
MFPMWQAALAHALLLDHDGLNGRQMAAGARSMARTLALLLADAPIGTRRPSAERGAPLREQERPSREL